MTGIKSMMLRLGTQRKKINLIYQEFPDISETGISHRIIPPIVVLLNFNLINMVEALHQATTVLAHILLLNAYQTQKEVPF